MSFFSVDHLTAGYHGTLVLDDVSFTLQPGRVVGILGANGSGKTTLLKAICGILPHGGRCTINHIQLESLTTRKLARLCGYIPQRSGITLDLAVLDVVLMGFNPRLGLLEPPSAAMKQAAQEALAAEGLADRAQDSFLCLSEGQKQLCILARSLVSDCKLLLLDEPESALDLRHRYELLRKLRHWVSDNERGVLVTLHDPVLALNECDELLLLSGGRLLGSVRPRVDDLRETERLLSEIYGPIELQQCQNRRGESQLVILQEENA